MLVRPARHLLVLIGAAALLRCGGSNPASPSGGGVKLQGVVLQRSSGTAASASVSASSAQAGKITVTVQENPSLSVTVSGNGTFEIQDLPAGGFTLVFSVNGVVVGQITITAVGEGTTIKIVVRLNDQEVELVDIETEDDDASAVQRARPAAARARPAARPSAAGPDLSASYSFLRAGEADLHGADVSASFPFWRSARLLADLSVHSGSFGGVNLKQTNFMGGVRRVFRPGRAWRPFGQAMLGGARATSQFADVLTSSRTAWGGALGA